LWRFVVLSYAVVIPATGRHGLARLLTTLDGGDGPPPTEIVIVDRRRRPRTSLDLPETRVLVRTVRSGGSGPVAARNVGWRSVDADWVVFVADDVLLPADWPTRLAADLGGLADDVACCHGAVRVPLPAERRPTDWERDVAERARANRTGAHVAYRRSALVAARGFDERFQHAHRADDDLVLRLHAADLGTVRGAREVTRPVGPTRLRDVLAAHSDGGDDALMRRIHGPGWRQRTNAPANGFVRHLLTCGAAACAAATVAASAAARASATQAAAAGAQPRGSVTGGSVPGGLRAGGSVTGGRLVPAAATLLWTGLTAGDALVRIGSGPRTPDEVLRVIAASIAVPPLAIVHRLRGEIRVRRLRAPLPAAVLFDRDGTLIDEVPGDGGVDAIVAARGAREALARLRQLGVPIGVLTTRPSANGNSLEPGEDAKVNDRVEALLGPFDVWETCAHAPGEACPCRQPHPGLIRRAAASLGVAPEACVVIGGVGGDLAAARAAGARGILVPTPRTRADEVTATAEVAADLVTAVELAVDGKRQ
jgi:HAD superfamily hydrolase (TIGR01662 family)